MEKVADCSNMVRIFRFLFVCAVLLAIAGCGFVGITLWYFGRDLPDYQQLAHYQPPIMTRVHAGDGRLLAEYATERRIFVPIQAIPKPVINAFLSAEDKNFYNHHGVDPVSILRAAITDVSRFRANRRPVGASTVTQQVAKNMLLSNEVSIERKVKEILLATRIEAALPKERILELYLNEIYLGSGRRTGGQWKIMGRRGRRGTSYDHSVADHQRTQVHTGLGIRHRQRLRRHAEIQFAQRRSTHD